MLSELRLENFRIFNDEVTIRFRPITILIGRNSSGKSSIIRFLLMLQQSTGSVNAEFLSPEGNSVSLGLFSALRNSLTRKPNLIFELKTAGPTISSTPAILQYLMTRNKAIVDASIPLSYHIRGSIAYNSRVRRGNIHYTLKPTTSSAAAIDIKRRVLEDSTFLFPHTQDPGATDFRGDEIRVHDSPAMISRKLRALNARTVRLRAEYELLDVLRYQIGALRYLSPIRYESARVILATSPPADYVGVIGQYALPHLQQLISDSQDDYGFILPHMQNIAAIDDIEFTASPDGYVTQAFAKNRTTGANVLISEYGFGVSQCLPILVQGALMPPYTSLVIEQPEAQLHPTAQLELGSFIADLWNKRNVGSIIETHSDNILLRLRRLIARGNLSHKDVSVAYFTFDEENNNMPVVKNLDIYDDGSMQAGLPMEFFGADIIEGLNLGART